MGVEEGGKGDFETLDRFEVMAEVAEASKHEKKGGGGKKNKKEMHHGKKTQEAIKLTLHEASRRNMQEYSRRHKNMPDDVDTNIGKTIERLVKIDEVGVGLPCLEEYMQWIYLSVVRKERPSLESECDTEAFKRSKGAGGQKVQKTESGIRLMHNFTGMRFEETFSRVQQENRKLAFERIAPLVEMHLERWEDYLTETDGEVRKLLVKKLKDVIGEKIESPGSSDNKKEAFERICGVIGREGV